MSAKKRIQELKIRIKKQRHELEGHVIDALDEGAYDVFEVIEYCESKMDNVDRLRACRLAYSIIGIDEKLKSVPIPGEDYPL